jgi:hypothetical protein
MRRFFLGLLCGGLLLATACSDDDQNVERPPVDLAVDAPPVDMAPPQDLSSASTADLSVEDLVTLPDLTGDDLTILDLAGLDL